MRLLCNRILLAVFVVFISTVTFRINAMYMGGVPVAEHCTWLPGSILHRGQTQEHAQCTRTRSPAAKIFRAKI